MAAVPESVRRGVRAALLSKEGDPAFEIWRSPEWQDFEKEHAERLKVAKVNLTRISPLLGPHQITERVGHLIGNGQKVETPIHTTAAQLVGVGFSTTEALNVAILSHDSVECFLDPDNELSAVIRKFEPTPNIVLIAKRCRQTREQIQTAGATATEPLWRAALSVTKFSEPDLSREISEGHSGFSDSELQAKLAGISAPFRCNTFEDAHPEGCKGCEFRGWINSPTALGYEFAPRRKRGVKK